MNASPTSTTPDPVPVPDALAVFLDAVFPAGATGLIELRALLNKVQAFVVVGDVAGVATFVEAHTGEDVYFGVATRRTRDGGRLEHCAELWAVFVDVDFKDTSEAEARTRIGTFPIPPHVIVRSGGGLHMYWRLREPFVLPAEADTARALLRLLAAHFGGDLQSAEPARVLRVVGTLNHKYTPVRPVVLDSVGAGTVDASELRDWLPAEPARPNGPTGASTPFAVPDTIHTGERNAVLYRVGRSLHAKGLSPDTIRAALHAENTAKCRPALSAHEVEAIATNAARQPDRPDFGCTAAAAADDGPFEVDALDLITRTREAAPVRMLIDGLVPDGAITLFHAQPRALKTWCVLDCGLSLATGTPALGALAVPDVIPVLYITNEDTSHVVGRRLDALLRARGLTQLPAPFAFAIHAGVWLDDLAWQARLVRRVIVAGYRVVILDPLRSLTGCVDQGPREFQPFARFCRHLMDEAGASLVLSHHDTKPVVGQRDTRQRPQRVSGGGIFSIADAPIHCERLGENDPAVSLIVPTLWKVSETPPALRVQLNCDADGARLTAAPLAGHDVRSVALDEQIMSFLRETPGRSTRAIATAVHADRSSVATRLERLVEAGQLDSRPGARNAVLWLPRRPHA